MRKFLSLATCIFILAFAGAAAAWMVHNREAVEKQPAKQAPPRIEAHTVAVTNLQLRVRSQGTVRPRTTTRLGSQVSGEILKVSENFEVGGRVQAGEVLLKIDPTDYQAAMAGAQARVASAELQLAETEADAANVGRDLQQLGLRTNDASDLVLRKPQLAVARANLSAATSELEQAKRNLERTTIKAPFDGILTSIGANRGQIITSLGTPLAELDATDVYEVLAPISDAAWSQLKAADGSAVEARLHAGDKQWRGVVDRSLGAIDARDRMLRLVVRVDQPLSGSEPLRIGQYVEIELLGQQQTEAICIPNAALLGQTDVLTISSSNTIHRRSIELGWKDETKVQVLSGIKPGERICLSRLRPWVEGMQVDVAEP